MAAPARRLALGLTSPWMRVVVLAAVCAALPWTIYGAKSAWDINANRIEDWLPDSFPETRTLMAFIERFGSDEVLLATWDGCTLDDPRLPILAEAIRRPAPPTPQSPLAAWQAWLTPEQPSEEEQASTADKPSSGGPTSEGPTYFAAVITGPEALDRLTEPPLSLGRDTARDRMAGWLLSDDGRTTCLVALIGQDGAADRATAVEWVRRCADGVDGLSRHDLRLAGPTFESVAIDEASRSNLLALNVWSWAVCLGLLYLALRSLRLALAVFFVALFNEQAIMAVIYFTAGQFDSVLLLTANLTFVLSISAGLHLANYYREAVVDGAERPATRAVREALTPSLLSATTTALGVASLVVSQIVPIGRFGLFSAIGVQGGTIVVLLVVGVLMSTMATRSVASVGVIWPLPPMTGRRLTTAVRFLAWPVMGASVAALLLGAALVTKLQTSVSLSDLFARDSEVLQDYRFVEERIGPLTPVEVIVSFSTEARDDADRPFATADRLRVIEDMHLAVKAVPEVESVVSARTFVRNVPPARPQGLRAIAAAGAARTRLDQARDALRYLRFVHDGITPTDPATGSAETPSAEDAPPATDGPDLNADGPPTDQGSAETTPAPTQLAEEDWRVSARVPSTAGHDFARIARDVEAVATAALARHPEQPARVWITGGMPVIQKAQTQLLSDLILSFLCAFGLIAVALMVVFRSIGAGLVAMIPNVLPSVVVFGVMAAWQIPVEIGAVLTATAAMGIAVDDSVHFITWFRRGLREGRETTAAVQYAYHRCGAAMIQTTLVCGLGLLVFAVSPFVPIARFGYLMAALLSIALVCDLLVLPAILVSPLGRLFSPRLGPAKSTS